MQELDLAIGARRVLHLDLVHADELLERVGIAVERLEDLRDDHLVRGLGEQALEGAERVDVLRVALENFAVDLDGGFHRAHALLAQVREPQHERGLLLLVARDRELAAHVVGEVAPERLPLEQRVERRERPRARGIELEDLSIQADRRRTLLEHLVVDLGHLREQSALLVGIGRDLGAPAEHAEQVTPPLGAPIERVEPEEHVHVARVAIENPAVGRDGRVHVGEA